MTESFRNFPTRFVRDDDLAIHTEGLGLEFSAEVKAAIAGIIEYPEAWSLVSKRTRRWSWLD
jgi:hypothetical protein